MRDNFIFYRSFFTAASTLPQKDRAKLIDAVIEYALNDKEPNLSGAASGMFELIRPQVDANNRRYENGCKGGRPTNKETKQKPKQNQDKTKQKPNVNVNVNDNDNDNDVKVGWF